MSLKTFTPPVMNTTPVSLFTNKAFEVSIIAAVESGQAQTFVDACKGMCQIGFKVNVLPKGCKAWQDACFDLAKEFEANFTMLEATPTNQTAALQKCQVVLFAGIPTAAELKLVQKKGLVAVLPWPSCEKFTDMMTFDAQQESGNCFLYTPQHTWDLAATMVRAFENYKFSYDWNQLKKRWKNTKI